MLGDGRDGLDQTGLDQYFGVHRAVPVDRGTAAVPGDHPNVELGHRSSLIGRPAGLRPGRLRGTRSYAGRRLNSGRLDLVDVRAAGSLGRIRLRRLLAARLRV